MVVKFNPKGYVNTPIMLFWLEFMLLPALGTGPTLLVMDPTTSKMGYALTEPYHRWFPAVELGLFNLSMSVIKIFLSRRLRRS